MATPITVAYGDGIGPEIMEATLLILKEAGAQLDIETIQIGEQMYKTGHSSGFDDNAWESINRTNVLLKAPITTPQGGGYKSLNVTLRKSLGLFANVRPCVSYHPFVETKHPKMDLVVVRENEEDIYAGIEYRLTDNVYESIKLITRAGSEKICRYAFEYAVKNNRKKVTCMVKDNIMKFTDGCFHDAFKRVAAEYPNIENESYIVDIGAARLANRPEDFDVVVTENLYGDVLSDITAETSGSVGLAGSSNIGEKAAMFEAIHGSAPDIAGQNIANPSGLLHGAVLMLNHIDQQDVATAIHNAWLKTIEDGIHTGDIFKEGVSKQKVGTKEFGEAVVENLGEKPSSFAAVDYQKPEGESKPLTASPAPKPSRKQVGVDVFVRWEESNQDALAEKCVDLQTENLHLKVISYRGLKCWPQDGSTTTVENGELFRCRFRAPDSVQQKEMAELISNFAEAGVEVNQAMACFEYDGERGYSLAQGE